MLTPDDVRGVTEMIWSTVLGLEVAARADAAPVEAQALAGCVQITGAWQGAVVLTCSARLARQAAGAMFGIDPDRAGTDEAQDAVGELANMTGGNLKALLPEPCALSLPAVVSGSDYRARVPGSRVVLQVGFDCEEQPFVVTVLERATVEGEG